MKKKQKEQTSPIGLKTIEVEPDEGLYTKRDILLQDTECASKDEHLDKIEKLEGD